MKKYITITLLCLMGLSACTGNNAQNRAEKAPLESVPAHSPNTPL